MYVINHGYKINSNEISQTTGVFKVRNVLKYLVESGLLLSSFSIENMLGGKKIKGFSSGSGEQIGKASFLPNKQNLTSLKEIHTHMQNTR